MQYQSNSEINYYGEEDEIGYDVSCNLGSIDIDNAVESDDFGDLIETSMRLLTQVSDITNIKQVPSVAKGNKYIRSVGLGVMNLHGHLMKSGIRYGSKESINFVDVLFSNINYHSLRASNQLAIERGETFYGFEGSTYGTGEYFDQYLDEDILPMNENVKKALSNVKPVTKEDWAALKESVMKYGIINGYRNCTAPTGSISYIRSATPSAAPITEKIEVRDYGNSRTIYPAPFLTKENSDDYIEAYDMDMYDMIDLYATAQKHTDQGLSITLYITDKWDTEQLAKLYIYAWSKKIKSIYYVRQRETTLEECLSCTI